MVAAVIPSSFGVVTGSFARTLPSLRAAVAGLDEDSLSGRRWFAGKLRRVLAVELADAAPIPGGGALVVAEVSYRDGGAERYLLPARLGGDGVLRDPEPADTLWAALARAVAAGAELGGLEGSFAARSPGERAVGGGGRRLTADQSNTSIVLGEQHVLKCYRRLEAGVNPEPDTLEALVPTGTRVAPRWRGTLVHTLGGEETSLAVLYDFVPGEPVGWEPLIEGVRASLTGEADGEAWLSVASELGTTAAELHGALGAAFGTSLATAGEAGTAVTAGLVLLQEALAVMPEDRTDELESVALERLHALERLNGATVGRVHGDLHVAQFVRSADGLVVVDFEGEPDRSLAERRLPRSPLRDVACLLLSLDHAAVAAARRCGFGETTGRALGWSAAARERTLDAYRTGVAATGNAVDTELLAALEVEKECRELLYAARVLPEWSYAPRLTLPRLLRSGPAA